MSVEPFPADRLATSRAPAGAERLAAKERVVSARRAVTGFPSRLSLETPDARPTAAGEMLSQLPEDAELSIVFRLEPDRDAPLCALRLRLEDEEELAERRMEQTLACVFPGVAFESGRRLRRVAYVRVPIRPIGLELRPPPKTPAHLAEVLAKPEGPRVIDPARRPMDIAQALALLAPLAPCDLNLRIKPWVRSAARLRALGTLKQRLAAIGLASDLEAAAIGDAARLAGDLRSRDGVCIDVSAGFDSRPDMASLEMVCQALFGRPLDTRGPEDDVDDLDLRGVWPASWPLPVLIPNSESLRRVTTASRKPAPPAGGSGDLRLGESAGGAPVALTARDRARHLYVIGATGTGKSSLLLNLLAQDIAGGEGVILLDPHGDLADDVAELALASRRRDVIVADAGDAHGTFRLDILAGQGGDPALERNYVANALVRTLSHILYANVPEGFGPMFELYFRNALFLIMDANGPAASLLDFERVFHDKAFRADLLERCADAKVVEFWTRIAPAVTDCDHSLQNMTPYITSKLTQFTGNPLMRGILAGGKGAIDVRQVMDAGQVLILKAAKGVIGQKDAELLCALTMIRIAQAAMARASRPRGERRPVRLYVDEFQTCAGDTLADLLAESRKYGLSLILANQSLGQVDGHGRHPDSGAAALANAANLIAFRVGAPDAARLAPWFAPDVEWSDLCRQRDFHAAARLLQDGAPRPTFTLRTARPPQSGQGR